MLSSRSRPAVFVDCSRDLGTMLWYGDLAAICTCRGTPVKEKGGLTVQYCVYDSIASTSSLLHDVLAQSCRSHSYMIPQSPVSTVTCSPFIIKATWLPSPSWPPPALLPRIDCVSCASILLVMYASLFPPFLSWSLRLVISDCKCMRFLLLRPWTACGGSVSVSSVSTSRVSSGCCCGREAAGPVRVRPIRRLEKPLGFTPATPSPNFAFLRATRSLLMILIVWSIPDTASIGSYGWPCTTLTTSPNSHSFSHKSNITTVKSYHHPRVHLPNYQLDPK